MGLVAKWLCNLARSAPVRGRYHVVIIFPLLVEIRSARLPPTRASFLGRPTGCIETGRARLIYDVTNAIVARVLNKLGKVIPVSTFAILPAERPAMFPEFPSLRLSQYADSTRCVY